MSEEIAMSIADQAELARLRSELRAMWAELEAARRVVAAMRRIDKHVIGAYETEFGDVEPCDECGEMREIAAQALAAYDEPTKARAE